MAKVYLYLFARGASAYRRAASPRDVSAAGHTWTRSAVSHSEPEMSGEAARDAVKILLPLTDAFANDYVKNQPDGKVAVTILKYDPGTDSSEYEWSGVVTYVEANGGEVTLQCEPESAGLSSATRAKIFMRQCPHAVYFGECRLNRADFAKATTITAVSGAVVTIDPTSDITAGELAGGVIEAADGTTRTIRAHSGNDLTLARPLPYLLIDPAVIVYPGCDRSPQRCASFPNAANPSGTNIENYGGHQWMLTGGVNPFAGSSVL